MYRKHGREGSRLRLEINAIIFVYMFICIALMIFNVLYIFWMKRRRRWQRRRALRWMREIEAARKSVTQGAPLPKKHRKRLERRLRQVDELMAYHEAISGLGEQSCQGYLDACHDSFQILAAGYLRRPPMERAYFARLMAVYHPRGGRERDQLIRLLLAFLKDATVYCRENVLQALYAMGSVGGVEQAYQFIAREGLYHHPRLLSDGLITFRGDRALLARQLWRHCPGWPEELQVAVVQFAAACTDTAMSGAFLEALKGPDTHIETRFALVRYFQRRPSPDAKPILLSAARREEDPLAVVACMALSRYPGTDTMETLKQALHSKNWYVRRNAAAALAALGAGEAELDELRRSGDRYAGEMLAYMTKLTNQAVEVAG